MSVKVLVEQTLFRIFTFNRNRVKYNQGYAKQIISAFVYFKIFIAVIISQFSVTW